MDGNLFEHSFYRAILCINDNNWDGSKRFLDNAWDIVDAKLSGMLRESYMRSYPAIVEL